MKYELCLKCAFIGSKLCNTCVPMYYSKELDNQEQTDRLNTNAVEPEGEVIPKRGHNHPF